MFILTNVSQDVDGTVYAGNPSIFKTKEDAIKNAKENLAEDFNITLYDITHEAQENNSPYVLSMSRNGRFEAYSVAEIPEKAETDLKTHEAHEDMKILDITASPYANQYGSILVPIDLETEDYENYVHEHFDEIEFDEPNLDYRGTGFEITERED